MRVRQYPTAPRNRNVDRIGQERQCILGLRHAYLIRAPASTGKVTPVMYRASSEARKSTALLMSTGSTHGIGSAFSAWEAGAKSASVGCSRSGRNSR